jgi:hypothetical protein
MGTNNSKSTFFFLLKIILSIGVFSLVLIFNRDLYERITYEDRFVEYLGFAFLLIAGCFLLGSGVFGFVKKNRNFGVNILLLIIGVVFIVAAFEEISWGQRVLGFDTPEKLLEINQQDEFNFHNIDKKFFDRVVDRSNIFFVFFAAIMILLKRKFIWGIRLPDTYLTLAFAIVPFYHQYNQVALDFYQLLYIPLILFIVRAIMLKKHRELVASLLTISTTLLLFLLHTKYNHYFPAHNNSANEVKETIFSIVCAYYAYTIFADSVEVRKLEDLNVEEFKN